MNCARSLTRCSQGQGAWAWQYIQQWLGLEVNRSAATLTVVPAGMLTGYEWQRFKAGPTQFDISWEETITGSRLSVRNHNESAWKIRAGFRQPGRGATARMNWQEREVPPGEEVLFEYQPSGEEGSHNLAPQPMTDAAILARDADAFSADGRIIFRRYGPALLWGHWDARRQWDLSEMPNALRFVVANLTDEDWTSVSITLECPQGWKAQGRQPKHWSPADDMHSGEVRLELGNLSAMSRTVAPFRVLAPGGRGLINQPAEPVSSHYPSQPGAGLTVMSTKVSQPVQATFTARLVATNPRGNRVDTTLQVPVIIEPVCK